VASIHVNLAQTRETQQWATFVRDAHIPALDLQQPFTTVEHARAILIAPFGNRISTAGDPSYVAQDLAHTIHTDVTPPPLGLICDNP
jgi:hypothetical protein